MYQYCGSEFLLNTKSPGFHPGTFTQTKPINKQSTLIPSAAQRTVNGNGGIHLLQPCFNKVKF